ncbi:MAG TPA: LptF/LptG family permease, partial [Cytophagaceae bacterium]|nr:LptF/LptG family permease [Cytophagaceae bacterium]
IGKGLTVLNFAELISYFCLSLFPATFPLGMLLASLITYGGLGEFNELTVIKSSGISLIRILLPIFLFAALLSIFMVGFNDRVIPFTNIKAYSLLYDLKQKKPSLEMKEGVFYKGLPGYSIRISGKSADGNILKNIMIYDHSQGRGNTDLILADSAKMYFAMENRYLILELFDGASYNEQQSETSNPIDPRQIVRSKFKKSKMIFSLASFDLNRTKEELFQGNRLMKNSIQLSDGIDSLAKDSKMIKNQLQTGAKAYYYYLFQNNDTVKTPYQPGQVSLNSLCPKEKKELGFSKAVQAARSIKAYAEGQEERIVQVEKEQNLYKVTKYQKYTQALACLILFLIGAPLGAIIKKGGLGVPVLVSICFFILYYVFSMVGEKWTREGIVEGYVGMWLGNVAMLPVGLFFLRQARNDSRIFETDFYFIFWDKIKNTFKRIFLKNK